MDKTLYSAGQQRLVALLIDARRRRKLTQAQLAERLGQRQPFVSEYESGRRRIDVVEFAAICAALGVKGSSLLRRWENAAQT